MLRGMHYFVLSRFDSYGRGGEDGLLELCWADFWGQGEAFFSLPQFEGATEFFLWGEVLRH